MSYIPLVLPARNWSPENPVTVQLKGNVWQLCGLKHFERYLYGKEFTIYSDHNPLTYLDSSKFANNRVLRLALSLQPYKFVVKRIAGKANVVADFLSKNP